ncbi:hypothetical protein ACU4GD_20475 [Cupriavidus basilensis]
MAAITTVPWYGFQRQALAQCLGYHHVIHGVAAEAAMHVGDRRRRLHPVRQAAPTPRASGRIRPPPYCWRWPKSYSRASSARQAVLQLLLDVVQLQVL